MPKADNGVQLLTTCSTHAASQIEGARTPKMSESQTHWLVSQLRRLAKNDLPSFEQFSEIFRSQQPQLFTHLALMAIEHGDLTPAECAYAINTDLADVDAHLQLYRQGVAESGRESLVEVDERGVARLTSVGITVWEVVRESRRLGSVDALKESFPGLTANEVHAAVCFADRHPEEISKQIEDYEEKRIRPKSAGPIGGG